MFGYATDETDECMPLTLLLAHQLNAKLAELRRNHILTWLRPDSKTQVTMVGVFGLNDKSGKPRCRQEKDSFLIIKRDVLLLAPISGDRSVQAGSWCRHPH